MKTWKFVPAALLLAIISLTFLANTELPQDPARHDANCCLPEKGCVFRTVFGEESSDFYSIYNTPEKVVKATEEGLQWILKAQQPNGGWGAGSHSRQDITDPHAVNTDPATTSMVSMALLRTGNTLDKGPYAGQLKDALEFLLHSVESSDPEHSNITTETNTQIQSKLGTNIDVIITSQFLSNLLETLPKEHPMKKRVETNLQACVKKIQNAQMADGSFSGSGWAGVLQSSMANNALESARFSGAIVDDEIIEKSRDYQQQNYNAETGDVNTSMGAGVVLYSVSGSTRASAVQARAVREEVEKAKENGVLDKDAEINEENLLKLGFENDDAKRYASSYKVYESAKNRAQQDNVMDGFGSNGGEEFLSYLQTGESLIINKDKEWTEWYENISGRLLKIQNGDGSWSGHHCITSPVYCTATCLLILSVNNDIDLLVRMGAQQE